jgi:hypothetical protein
LELTSAKIELVENCPCNSKEELLQREGYYIRNNNCVNKFIPDRTRKEYLETNKEKLKEYHKKYDETNKERIAERKKNYSETNKEKLKEYHKKYYQQKKEEKKEN